MVKPNPLINAVGADATVTGLGVIAITPHDSTNLTTPVRAIRCKNTGTAGTVAYIDYFGNVSSTEIALGEQRNLYCRRVNNTNTTADGLEGII